MMDKPQDVSLDEWYKRLSDQERHLAEQIKKLSDQLAMTRGALQFCGMLLNGGEQSPPGQQPIELDDLVNMIENGSETGETEQ